MVKSILPLIELFGDGNSLQEKAQRIRDELIANGKYHKAADRKYLSDRDKNVVRLRFQGMHVDEVMAQTGFKTRVSIYNIMKSPIGMAYYLDLQEKADLAVTQAQANIQLLAPRAVRVIDARLPGRDGEAIPETPTKEQEATAWEVLNRTQPKAPSTLINVSTQTNIAVLEKEAHAKTEGELIDAILTNKGGES